MNPPIIIRIFKGDELVAVKQFSDEGQILFGRNPELNVQLDDDRVGPIHALIEKRDTGFYVSDLGSVTGTLINGKKVLDAPIQSGDSLSIAGYRIEFFVGAPKPVGAPGEVKKAQNDESLEEEVSATPVAPELPSDEEALEVTEEIEVPGTHSGTLKISKDDLADDWQTNPSFSPTQTGTFAPPSELTNLDSEIKPSKGTTIEVIVAWRERVVSTYHFHEKQLVTVGTDSKADISLPLLGVGKSSHTLIKIEGLATVCVLPEMTGSYQVEGKRISLQDMVKSNRMIQGEEGFYLQLEQGSMLKLELQGGLVNLYIRYIPEAAKPIVAPLLDLTASEVTGVILAVVVAAIFGLYMMVYSPAAWEDEARVEEPIRKAFVTFKRPKSLPKKIEQAPQPVEKKVVKITEKKKTPKTPSAAQKKPGPSGKMGGVKPNPNLKSKKGKVVSARPGGAKKISDKSGASAKSKKKDVSKLGLLGAFGSKGTQKKLDKFYSGAGELAGAADQATGFAGQASDREGDVMGTNLKATGSGSGKNTIGISGVGTKGRGSGSYGYGTGGLGKKSSVEVNVEGQEAEFVGSIDRDAIRRVILAHKRVIRSCYEKELNRNPDLFGKLVLEWDIEERGKVTRVSVKRNGLGNQAVANCLMRNLKTWTFPEPPPDQIGRVTYPFVFASQ